MSTPQPSPPPALTYQSPFGNTDTPIWSNGKHVVAMNQSRFPARCFKCNTGENLKIITKTLAWNYPAMYLLLLFPGLLIGGIIILVTQKKGSVVLAVCASCRARRNNRILMAWGIFAGSIVAFILAAVLDTGWLVLLGILLLLGSLFYAAIATSLCSAARIENNVLTIRGAGPEFLGSLNQNVKL